LLALLAQAEEPITEVTNQIQFNAFTVSAILSLIIPVLTGLATKITAPPAVKQILTIVLSGVAAVISQNVVGDGSSVITKEVGLLWAMNLAIAITSYLGIYKPNDLNSNLAPNSGLGPDDGSI
jgi:hypothetical protein